MPDLAPVTSKETKGKKTPPKKAPTKKAVVVTKTQWLKEPPPPDYIINSDDTKRDYIPIGLVEVLLDELCDGSQPWSTENFSFEVTRHATAWFATAQVDLIVHYDGHQRRVVGAKSFIVSGGDDNKDYAGSALSQCITSAASKLGNKFGRALNHRLEAKKPELKAENETSKKPKIDKINLQKYINACKTDDKQTVFFMEKNYDMNDPEAIKEINKQLNPPESVDNAQY